MHRDRTRIGPLGRIVGFLSILLSGWLTALITTLLAHDFFQGSPANGIPFVPLALLWACCPSFYALLMGTLVTYPLAIFAFARVDVRSDPQAAIALAILWLLPIFAGTFAYGFCLIGTWVRGRTS